MHYFLFVDLPGFYVRVWETRDPARAKAPLAVHRDKHVLDLNASAADIGVRIGMRVDEAKLLLASSGLIGFEEEPYREAQSRWLDAMCEFSSSIEPVEPHAAFADLSGHPDPYDLLPMIARKIQVAINLTPRMGLSSAKWVARRSVLSGAHPFTAEDWVQRPSVCLYALPVSVLDPVEVLHRERLKFLGYRTIGAVSEIPLRTLKGQFGDAAMVISSASQGRSNEPVRPLYPPDSIVLKHSYPGGLDDLEALRTAIDALAKSCAYALSTRSAVGENVEVVLEHDTRIVSRRRTFSRPIRTSREVGSALTRLIGKPSESVQSITVRMPKLRKAEERQSGLFVTRVPGDDVAAKRTVDRVRGVFGDHSIVRASEIVVPRRVRVLRAWSHATGWK